MSTKCYLPVVHHQIFITWNAQQINRRRNLNIQLKQNYNIQNTICYFYSYLYIFFKICKI